MASKKLILTCCMAFLGLAFADIMPKDIVSKMQVVENEAKALMHTEPKRAIDDFVDPSLSRLMKKRSGSMMKQKRPEFMGYAVSIPQYIRLVNLQDATIEMDRYMKQLAMKFSPQVLMTDPSWRELVLIYRSLEKLLPEDVKNENKEVVWWL